MTFIVILQEDLPLGFGEGVANGGVKGKPGLFADFRAEFSLEHFVESAVPCEVRVAHEEAFAALVPVDEPAIGIVGAAGAKP